MGRVKTNYKNIYYNEDTKKYDVKYNYKVYDAITKKNKYKSKWKYNINTLTEAKNELANLQINKQKIEDKDITLEGIYDLWKLQAQAKNYSLVSLRNTHQQFNMICNFLDKDTKLKDITDDVYYKFSSDCRSYGYSEETLHSINATFRKFINLAYKKKLIKNNVLHTCDNIRTKDKEDYKLITKDDFDLIDSYIHNNKFVRLGVDLYPKYRLLFNILYYTGARIGEVLALTYADFEEFNYYKRNDEYFSLRIASAKSEEHLRGLRMHITKAYVSDLKLTKDPKNFKKRYVPCYCDLERLFIKYKNNHLENGGSINDKIFNITHSAVDSMIKKACKECNLTSYSCHDFRHTFISNMIRAGVPLPVVEKVSGDTQETILKRYSHMFESDEMMILNALNNMI